MKEFIKSYYPILISVLYFYLISFVCKASFIGTDFIDVKIFILVVIAVIAAWAEIIGFMIHAGKNKEIKNKALWIVLIYFFNLFIIPYYNIKYVAKKNRTVIPMILFIVLSILGVIFGIVSVQSNIQEKGNYIFSEDRKIQFEFSEDYIKRNVGEYDIYASNYTKGINVGAFIYDETYNQTSDSLHNNRKTWLYTSRDNVEDYSSNSYKLDDKEIIIKSYLGEFEGESFIYQISTIEFFGSGYIIETIQIVSDDDYNEYKEELDNILKNVKYINK